MLNQILTKIENRKDLDEGKLKSWGNDENQPDKKEGSWEAFRWIKKGFRKKINQGQRQQAEQLGRVPVPKESQVISSDADPGFRCLFDPWIRDE